MDRRVVLGSFVAVAVAAAAGGWFAGQRIQSPAEVAANAAPPPASLISVPVELRTLSQSVVVRGTITPSDETSLSVTSVDGESVVTRLPKESGDAITEGDVVVEVAGRPVIALAGPLPAFRSLIPGLQGPEVRQLEEALVRLGYDPGDVDDIYTTATATAVEALYRDRGYTAPPPDAGDEAAASAAEAAVAQSEADVDQATRDLADAEEPVGDVERTRLDLDVSQAEFDLEQAEATATASRKEAADAATAAQKARDEAAAAVEADDNDETRAALDEAEAALTAATNAVPRVDGEQDLLVRQARLAVDQAKVARDERLAAPDLSTLRSNLTKARASLNDARAELTDAEAKVGAWIPVSEVAFFSSLPRQVGEVFAEVGDAPSSAVMTVSGAETLVESGIPSADRSLVAEGDEALLEEDDLGLSIRAVITFLADSPGGPGLSSDRYAMRLEPLDDVPEEALGVSFRVSIPVTSSGGDVLAVPLAAVSAGPDGTPRVEVERAGTTAIVEVSTGLRAQGLVEITPLDGGLEAGDRVVVGRDLQLPGSDEEEDADGESGDG